jgi:hypothetical protein
MPYGGFTKPQVLNTIVSKNLTTGKEYLVRDAFELTTLENRAGSNHGHIPDELSRLIKKYSFSKDGKTLRVYLGTQRTPIKRFRWVGSRANRRKQYYIEYVDRHIYTTVPKPNYTYRAAKSATNHVQILRPNPLTYQLENYRYPSNHVIYGRRNTPHAAYVVNFDGGLYGNMEEGDFQSNMNYIQPFNMVDWNPTGTQLNNCVDDATRRLYEKVASRFPDVGTMLGESKETLGMIRTLLNEGVDLITDLIKKDKKRLLGRLKTPATSLSNAWLTYVYGLKPLVSDLQSLQSLPNQWGLRTYTTKSTYEARQSAQVEAGLSSWDSTVTGRLDVRMGVIMSADLSGTQSAAAMNLFNPIGIGYQLIPFSFMVDWIYDMGGFLNSQSALQFGFLYGWKTVTVNKQWQSYQSTGVQKPNYSLNVIDGWLLYQKDSVSCSRVVLNQNSFPEMPAPKLDLSSMNSIRGINALSILVQRHNAFSKL